MKYRRDIMVCMTIYAEADTAEKANTILSGFVGENGKDECLDLQKRDIYLSDDRSVFLSPAITTYGFAGDIEEVE